MRPLPALALALCLSLFLSGCGGGGAEEPTPAERKRAGDDLRRTCGNIAGAYERIDRGVEAYKGSRAASAVFLSAVEDAAAQLPNITSEAPPGIQEDVPAAVAALEEAAAQFRVAPLSTDLEPVERTRQELSASCAIAFTTL